MTLLVQLYMRKLRVGFVFFFFSSRRRHTRCSRDWSSDVCSPISARQGVGARKRRRSHEQGRCRRREPDRKSTRLNSSHGYISYAVFCLKKKKIQDRP